MAENQSIRDELADLLAQAREAKLEICGLRWQNIAMSLPVISPHLLLSPQWIESEIAWKNSPVTFILHLHSHPRKRIFISLESQSCFCYLGGKFRRFRIAKATQNWLEKVAALPENAPESQILQLIRT